MNTMYLSLLSFLLFAVNVTNAAPVDELEVVSKSGIAQDPSEQDNFIEDVENLIADTYSMFDQSKKNIGFQPLDANVTEEVIVCLPDETACLLKFCKWETEENKKICHVGFYMIVWDYLDEYEVLDYPIDNNPIGKNDVQVCWEEFGQPKEMENIANSDKEEEEEEKYTSKESMMEDMEKENNRDVQKEGADDKDTIDTAETIECGLVSGNAMCLVEVCKQNEETKKTSCNIVLRDADDASVDNEVENEQETIEVDSGEEGQKKEVITIADKDKDNIGNELSHKDTITAVENEIAIEGKENSLLGGNHDWFDYKSITEVRNLVKKKRTCISKRICKWNLDAKEISCWYP